MDDEYQVINISTEPSPDIHGLRKATVETSANRWARLGWETVSVMPSRGPGYADAILIKRKPDPLAVVHTDQNGKETYFKPEEIKYVYSTDGM
jgi:hypothetical protein